MPFSKCAQGETRTLTVSRTGDFESAASTIKTTLFTRQIRLNSATNFKKLIILVYHMVYPHTQWREGMSVLFVPPIIFKKFNLTSYSYKKIRRSYLLGLSVFTTAANGNIC